MPKLEISVDHGFYESETVPFANQSCVNLYPKHAETKDTLSKGALYRTPGIISTDTVQGVGRGFLKDTINNYLYIVAGTTLYRKSNVGLITNIGTITGTGRVSMAWNGITLVVVAPGTSGYFYTIASGLAPITATAFTDQMTNANGGVTSVCYKDSRFIYSTDDDFFIGKVISTNNGQDFEVLDYETAEVKADPIVSVKSIKNELYVFGKETIELYQVTGGAGFPYVRIPGATIEKGLAGRNAVVPFDNSFLFLGSDTLENPSIWRGASGFAQKVTTSAIDKILQTYTEAELETVSAWTYNDGGSWFAGFNLPDRTLVYDASASSTQQRPVWHERKTNDTTWRVEDCISAYGHIMVIDNLAGKVGYLDRAVSDEYGTAIDRTFSGGYLQDQGDSFRVSSIELKVSAGVGNLKGTTDSNPTVEMLMSKDGGNTFVSFGTRKIGMQGEFNKRLIWRRVGRVAHNVMFKFVMNGTVAVDFYRIDIEVKGNDKKGM